MTHKDLKEAGRVEKSDLLRLKAKLAQEIYGSCLARSKKIGKTLGQSIHELNWLAIKHKGSDLRSDHNQWPNGAT